MAAFYGVGDVASAPVSTQVEHVTSCNPHVIESVSCESCREVCGSVDRHCSAALSKLC